MSNTSQKRFYQQNCEMLFWQFWCLYHHPFKALEMGRFWKIRGSTKLERKNGVLWQKVWSKHAFTGANQLPIQDFSITSMFLLWSLSGHLTLQSMLHLFRCIGRHLFQIYPSQQKLYFYLYLPCLWFWLT